jgi:hypothetical protein
MDLFMVILITGIIYMLPGLIWYVWEVYSEWYKGEPIRGEDVINLPIAMLLWPALLVDNIMLLSAIQAQYSAKSITDMSLM